MSDLLRARLSHAETELAELTAAGSLDHADVVRWLNLTTRVRRLRNALAASTSA